MCGFVGQLNLSGKTSKSDMDINITNMTRFLEHRGPDGVGFFRDKFGLISIGHRRLSILDISEKGSQPFESPNGRYIIAFNGEIYNHLLIRKKIEKSGYPYSWESNCDTETLMAGLMMWDLEVCLSELNGMFAFALWDKEEKELILCRDRMGIKPLYYGFSNGDLLFSSEIKAIKAHPKFEANINKDALALYLRYAYVPTPFSIYQGINKLPQGHYIRFNFDKNINTEPKSYWDLSSHFCSKNKVSDGFSSDTLVKVLEDKLVESIRLRMLSDVELGAFLSGGVDSSLIVALMQKISLKKVNTFTIGFERKSFNEAIYAKNIASYLGTNHTELYISEKESLNLAYKCGSIWDEPFGDSSQIPMLLLSTLTSKNVKVALSGDGGDELFCGYNRYGQGYRLFQILSIIPHKFLELTFKGFEHLDPKFINKVDTLLSKNFKFSGIQDKMLKIAKIINVSDKNLFYKKLISCFDSPNQFLLDGFEPETLHSRIELWPDNKDFRDTMMYLDCMTYLVDDILTKVDRATMSQGLEARVPFLDHNLIEWSSRLPLKEKIKNNSPKWLLKKILEKYVPNSYFNRPKMGFGVPLSSWLKGPLKVWAYDLLSESRIKDQGLFNYDLINRMLEENFSNQRFWHHQLWTLLMFQSWYYDSHLGT